MTWLNFFKGVFCGDKELKSVIQWIAASVCGRELHYYSFGDDKFTAAFLSFIDFVQQQKIPVSVIFNALLLVKNASKPPVQTFETLKYLLSK